MLARQPYSVAMCEAALRKLRELYGDRPDWRVARRIKMWEDELAKARVTLPREWKAEQ